MAVYKKGAEKTILSTAYSNYIEERDLANLGQFNPGVLALLYCTNTLFYRRYN
jgi:hypothetical protein